MRFIFKAKDGKQFAGHGQWGKLLAERMREVYDRQHEHDERRRRVMLHSTERGWVLK